MKKEDIITIIIACLVVVFDQLSKFLVSKSLSLNQSIGVIKNVFHLTLIHNTGTVFGVLKGYNLIFIILSLAIIAFIIYYLYKTDDFKEEVLLALVLGGAIGNLIDRIIFGHVIDFIDFRVWPAFNIADSAVTIGVILLVVYLFKKK